MDCRHPNPPDLQEPQIPPLSVCGGLMSPYRIDPERLEGGSRPSEPRWYLDGPESPRTIRALSLARDIEQRGATALVRRTSTPWPRKLPNPWFPKRFPYKARFAKPWLAPRLAHEPRPSGRYSRPGTQAGAHGIGVMRHADTIALHDHESYQEQTESYQPVELIGGRHR